MTAGEVVSICSTLPCVLTWLDSHLAPVVALIAIGLTLWQIRTVIAHNKRSVRPWLFFALDHGMDNVTFSLRNYVLGPAYIQSVRYYIARREIDVNDDGKVLLGKRRQ